MLDIKSQKNKSIAIVILHILFTILLILILIQIRTKALGYVQEIQDYSGDLDLLAQEITNEDLNLEQRSQIDSTVTDFNKLLNKALLLLKLILPLSIIILFLIFFYPIWHLTNKISIKRYLAYAIIPLILLLAIVYFTLNYIAYYYSFVENNPIIYLLISSILFIIIYYISLFGLSTKKSFKKILGLCLNKLLSVFPYYGLLLITGLVYLVLVFWIFFLTFVEASILLQSIILVVIIVLITIQRRYIVKNISKD